MNSPSPFDTTQWTLVLAAGHRSRPESEQALADLCSRYWLPVYSFIRRQVAHSEAAQDLTQQFFAQLLERNVVASADPERGRFRTFLLTCVKRFLANEWERDKALKRGGGQCILSFDFSNGESRLALEPIDHLTPERLFHRQWTLTLLNQVMQQLEAEMRSAGKLQTFQILQPFLSGKKAPGAYEEAATQLQTSAGAARVAVHRLRTRLRVLLREEIAQTVSGQQELDEEIGQLFASLQAQ